MVNTEMFKGAFDFKSMAKPANAPVQQQPQYIPNPNYVAPAPQPMPVMAPAPNTPEDPDVAKFRFMMLKWLSIIIGGAAILLVVWRIILKFI